MAARAGVHRRDELEARRELGLARSARDRDPTVSSGSRSASRAARWNSRNSSGNSTPSATDEAV
jgi:hypothetical protein